MAAHITVADAQAWLEGTKLNLTALDADLERQVSSSVLGRLQDTYDSTIFGVPTWVDSNTTPEIVRQCIAMFYAGWFYDRQYAEMVATEGASYGLVLRENAEELILGLIVGSIEILEILPNQPDTAPVFYPTDATSTEQAVLDNTNTDDLSLGGNVFGMSKVF